MMYTMTRFFLLFFFLLAMNSKCFKEMAKTCTKQGWGSVWRPSRRDAGVARSAPLNVGGNVDLVGQLGDVDVKAVLDLVQCLGIRFVGDEGHCQALGTESSRSGNPMEVCV
uniref:Putative secreted protein n=1 Tax=Ixodes ricinus TaxID=34613 RepID=A0A6B0UJ76_IXORI